MDKKTGIYPEPNHQVLETLNSLVYCKGLKLNLGIERVDISISDSHKLAIKKALNYLDKTCKNCTGDHRLWVVAGNLLFVELFLFFISNYNIN